MHRILGKHVTHDNFEGNDENWELFFLLKFPKLRNDFISFKVNLSENTVIKDSKVLLYKRINLH